MVVDHVHAHAQACVGQAFDHAAELNDPLGTVLCIAGVAALGCGVVQRVVAPVKAIAAGQAHHKSRLPQIITRCAGRWLGRVAAALLHTGHIKHGQQVHVR